MNLVEAIKIKSGSVVVVDDDLVPPNFSRLDAEAYTRFYQLIDGDSKARALTRDLLRISGDDDGDVVELMTAVETRVDELWSIFRRGEHEYLLKPLLGDFAAAYDTSRHRVDTLVEFLRGYFEVEPLTFSSIADAGPALRACALAFVDFYLGGVTTAEQAMQLHAAAKNELSSEFELEQKSWPKVIMLMSSRLPRQEELTLFRNGTGIKSAFFSTLDKKDIADLFLRKTLDRCLAQYDPATQLNGYLQSIRAAIRESANSLDEEVSRLELHDLTTLKSLRLDAESESVQGYLTWFLSEALASKLRSNSNLQRQLLPSENQYPQLDGKLLPGSVLFELFSDIAVAPLSPAGGDTAFSFGDVIEDISGSSEGERSLLLVISPACDLIRCLASHEVLCVRGLIHDTSRSLHELLGKAYAFGKGKLVLKHVQAGMVVYSRITWEIKRLCTIKNSALKDDSNFKRIARLSEVFAQEIKDLALSQVSRVGTPVDPSFSIALQAFVRIKINVAKGIEISFQADLVGQDYVPAVLAMGRIPSTDGEREADPLEKTVIFSYQFQDWILDELGKLMSEHAPPPPNLSKLCTYFGRNENLMVTLSEAGEGSAENGVIKFKYFEHPTSVDNVKNGLEVALFPYQRRQAEA
ncbi:MULTISPECIES: hypothetical protein [Paraburkholderia]|uniref:hypothetical protein n=1 Tax=Paraburkholderia TaxID=1822464 RepID=UPI0022512E92|nr:MULTISPECIES: hypothetical protein [Paraburkholderia]MCX4164593.1 hypothetical protein [Paraburkholderia megapolitana]MDN7160086.1 hypothetical protein [Paraburkholderia sp. CHISQ3]MDQ6497133.1 hypothetical protein [Paraburkholderia megapolitana]